jgi:glycosyltransferase involved in cell wall biosynthesis
MAEVAVKIIGPIYDIAGLSQIVRETALALNQIGITVQLVDVPNFCKVKAYLPNDVLQKLRIMQATPLNSKYVAIHAYPIDAAKQVDANAAANIAWSIYETNKIPHIWKLILNNDLFKEVWTASEFNKKTYIDSGVKADKLSIVNLGVNTSTYKPGLKPLENIREKGNFYFLYVSALKYCKGFDILLKAFFDEFRMDGKVKLIFKADMHSGSYDQEKQYIKNIIKTMKGDSRAEVLCLSDNLNEEFMARLYSTADCFVLPSRGEGWGLGYIQSMACGVPVIATDCSAQTTFCNSENSLMVPTELQKIDNLEWLLQVPLQNEHSWYEPDYNKLKEQMRWAYRNSDKLVGLGKKANEDVQKYDWQNIAMQIVSQIAKYAE